MTQQYNPFTDLDLFVPLEQYKYYNKYVQGRENAGDEDKSPFRRMIDLWFLGLVLATRENLKPRDLTKQEVRKFQDGSILDGDGGWRVQAVMLVAIWVKNDVKIINAPKEIIKIANELAAAGVPRVLDMIENGNQDPIWNLSEALDAMLNDEN